MANSRGIRAGRAFVELGVDDRLAAGLRAAQKRLQAFGAGLRSLGTQLVAAGAAASAPFALATATFTKAGDELDKMAKRTGVSVEALSELAFAAEQSGADITKLEDGLRAMQRGLFAAEKGTGEAKEGLDALGLTVAQLRGLAPEDQFAMIAEAISKVEDPTRRAAIAMRIFGDSGTRLLPLLEAGARGIAELRREAERLGLTISTETAQDAASLADAFNRLRKVLRITAISVGAALAPAIERITTAVTRIAKTVNDWITENAALIRTVAQVTALVIGAGSALIALGAAVSFVGAVFGGLATVVTAAGAALGVIGTVLGAIVTPIGAVITAVVAGGAALLYFSGVGGKAIAYLRERFGELSAFIGRVFGGIRDALAAGDLGLAAEIAWKAIRLAFLVGTADIRAIFQEGVAAIIGIWQDAGYLIARTWASVTSFLARSSSTVFEFIAKQMTGLAASLGLISEQAEQLIDGIVSATSKGARGDSLRELREEIEALDEAQRRDQDQRLDDAAKRFEERKKALEKARDDLQRALDEARRAREEADSLGSGAGVETPDFAGVAEATKGAADTRGTFNAFATQGLQTIDPLRERELRAAERTAAAIEEALRFLKRRPTQVLL